MATHSSIIAQEIPQTEGAWWATVHGVAKDSDAIEHNVGKPRQFPSDYHTGGIQYRKSMKKGRRYETERKENYIFQTLFTDLTQISLSVIYLVLTKFVYLFDTFRGIKVPFI